MVRIVSIIKDPHVGYVLVDKDGKELSWDERHAEALRSIWYCEYLIFYECDGYMGVSSAQYRESFQELELNIDHVDYIRPLDVRINMRFMEEFIAAHQAVEKCDRQYALEHVLEVLRGLPDTPMDKDVREKYDITL